MRKTLPAIILAILVFATATADAQKILAIIGSSTSACNGPTGGVDSCYVGRLRLYYDKNTSGDTVIDNGYAVPGYNCYNGMPSSYIPPYPWTNLYPDPVHHITAALAIHPNAVLVNYPTNAYDTLRIDSILYCLRTIRDSANKAGVPCFITTTQPRTTFSTPAKAKLMELKDSILLEMGAFAVNFWDGLADPSGSILPAYNADGVHLNNAGHDTLFHRVLAKNVFLAALPATFIQFNTVYKNNTNIISWATAKEAGIGFYEIQRSADGTSFSKIAVVNANNNAGNNQYQYIDNQPLKGWTYYKILIVDMDGKKHASPVMSVHINSGKLALLKAFANASSQVVVELQSNEPQNAQLQLFNNTGLVISSASRKIEPGNTTLYLNTPVLSNGVYHIKLTTPRGSLVSSFIKN